MTYNQIIQSESHYVYKHSASERELNELIQLLSPIQPYEQPNLFSLIFNQIIKIDYKLDVEALPTHAQYLIMNSYFDHIVMNDYLNHLEYFKNFIRSQRRNELILTSGELFLIDFIISMKRFMPKSHKTFKSKEVKILKKK